MNDKELKGLINKAKRDKTKKIDLSKQSISEFPSEIIGLTHVEELNLSDNQLEMLPKRIGNLVNLKILDISRNKLTTLPKEIGILANLEVLNLNNNELVSLPTQIGELTNLSALYLSGNHVGSLPKEIGNLKSLEMIYLTANKIRNLPSEIGNLSKLQILECYGNLLTNLPKEIGKLTGLKILYLSGNPLKSVPVEISLLRNLEILHLKHNRLRTLPKQIVELRNLQEIRLHGNPLRFPPIHIAEEGVEAIKEYVASVEKDKLGTRILFEAKLMVVGQGEVGKTSIVNRLLYDFFDEREQATKGVDIETWDREITDTGIDVKEWELRPDGQGAIVRMNVWDFGGQEIYYATHQFFLTKDSIYLLVCDTRQGDQSVQLNTWLHRIESFAGRSPIVLVLNKCDVRIQDINLKDLKESFPQIKGSYRVSCKEPKKGKDSFELLRDEITKVALEMLGRGTKWSQSWLNVRKAIGLDDHNYITYPEYLNLCTEYEIEGKEAKVLSEYLHKLGVILHFKDWSGLRDILILKPTWVTDAVYAILRSQSVRDRGGVLQHSELGNILKPNRYPAAVYPTLLNLLSRFELAYELGDKEGYLVPELLPTSEPEIDWGDTDSLTFFYHYDFLPTSLISRFIVLAHDDLEEDAEDKPLCWRDGAILRWEDTRASVRARKTEKTLEIRIAGQKKRELLAIIRHELDHINRSLEKTKITQQIPCRCSAKCQNRFDYEALLDAERKSVTRIQCQDSWVEVSLSSLLDGYEKREDRVKDRTKGFTDEWRPVVSVQDKGTVILAPQSQIDLSKKEEHVIQERVIKIGDKASILAPIVIADSIENSFNVLMESTINDNVKTLLEQLLRAVNEVNKEVSQDQIDEAKTMVRDAEALVKEATGPNPRRRWYEVCLESLKNAAPKIGEIAIPVIDIANKLALLLLA